MKPFLFVYFSFLSFSRLTLSAHDLYAVFILPLVPGEVSSLSVTAMSPSTVHTKWQPPLEPFGLKVLGYTVIVFPNNTIEYDTFKVANTVTEITIDNLKANSAYSIGVYVSSTTGSGPASFTPSILTHRNSKILYYADMTFLYALYTYSYYIQVIVI